jgi:hypothetical protein
MTGQKMTHSTEDLLHALSEELGELHLKWLLFSQLYEDEEIVDLPNESAPNFFWRLPVCIFR